MRWFILNYLVNSIASENEDFYFIGLRSMADYAICTVLGYRLA